MYNSTIATIKVITADEISLFLFERVAREW